MPTKLLPSTTRSWGTRFDSLPPPSPASSPVPRESAVREIAHRDDTEISFDTSDRRKEDKMPHDASVFVGSLPTNMEQAELSRLLSAHLSEHAQVQNVKVVRDSKGGVCAFVQCEDAAAANSLIQTLHSTEPKPFLGRHLRYEPARAFRTLLVSYRIPTQFVPNVENTPAEYGRGKHVNLDLPFAMRLWKPRNSRYLAILYNAEAVDSEARASVSQFDSEAEHALHLQPVACDDENIQKICGHFGELESFRAWTPDEADLEEDDSSKQYPYPHNARRNDAMDPRCFEIKWAHRDDCVNALMTLRRVPHLTVTWAHQPNAFGGRHSPYHNTRTSNATMYPMYLQERDSDRARARTMTGTFSTDSRRDSDASTNVAGNVSHNSGWKLHSQPLNLSRQKDVTVSSEAPGSTQGEWNDADFPPLLDDKLQRQADFGVWSDRKIVSQNDKGMNDIESNIAHMSLSESQSFDLTKKRSFLLPKNDTTPEMEHDLGQELDMPPTPGLGMSPITPRTPGMMFPATPSTGSGDFHGLFPFNAYDEKRRPAYEIEEHGERSLDPTTLFVGGLEMYGTGAWDEEKVGNFFRKFGGLTGVKVVRPVNGKAAFAFVKFDNTESPARAVAQEHNRIYEGRAMRVQLRDCNPPRGSWKFQAGRGRGRYPMHGGGHRHYDEPEIREQVHRPEVMIQAKETREHLPIDSGKAEFDPAPTDENLPPSESYETVEEVNQDQKQTKQDPPVQETYREWYDVPASATMTPPPVVYPSAGANVQTSAPNQFTMPLSGYYPPPPWLQSYGAVQYPMFYPGFPAPNMPPSFAAPPSNAGSDASGPASAPPMPVQNYPPMYGAYIPYPSFPTRPPQAADPQAMMHQQPPLAPTGFIQNDQGTLIAVYPPEALDQYMSQPITGGQNVQNWVQAQTGTFVHGAPRMAQGMQSRQMLPAGNWIHPPNQAMPPSQQAFRPNGHDLNANQLNPSIRRKHNNRGMVGHRGGRPGLNHQLDQHRTVPFASSPPFV